MRIVNADCGVCEACIEVCPLKIIKKKGYTVVIEEGCDNCEECVEVCPIGCIVPDDD